MFLLYRWKRDRTGICLVWVTCKIAQHDYSTAQGWTQGFWKEGAPKLRTVRSSAPVGTGVSEEGVCALSEGEKYVIFKVNSHNLLRPFCLRRPQKVRSPISAKNRGGCLHPPLNPPLQLLVVVLDTCYPNQVTWILLCIIPIEVFRDSCHPHHTL